MVDILRNSPESRNRDDIFQFGTGGARFLLSFQNGTVWNIGGTEDANIVKFYTDKPCVSYLHYPDFESIAHPSLLWAMLIDLRELSVKFRDYSQQENLPILHRKETFLSQNRPLYTKFAKFTKSEEAAGLFSETKTIGNQQGWERRLESCGVKIKGHRLYKSQPL
jgi:DNA phosphorothioation-associated putative methyltransferase